MDADGAVLLVVGVTGAVGRAILATLGTRPPVWREIRVTASPRHAGETVRTYGREVEVQELTDEVFEGADVAVIAMPPAVAPRAVEMAQRHGVPAVDCSPAFRADPDVPLVVPEINPAQAHSRPRGIVASPSASAVALSMALAPLHHTWGLNQVVVTAMQAVSGVGDIGTSRLRAEVGAVLEHGDGTMPGGVRRAVSDLPGDSPFPAPVVSNVVPVTSVLDSDGWSVQEARTRREVRRVLGAPHLAIAATTVWVPVPTSHSLSVHATFDESLSADEARQALVEGPNSVVVLDDPENADWPSPIDSVGSEPTFVGRIRVSPDFPNSLEMFVVTDNLRKGSALNMLQIAEAIAGEQG